MREAPAIDSWGGGGFRVSGLWRPGSLLILDDRLLEWAPTGVSELRPLDFAQVISAGRTVSEFLLLGAGPVAALPPRAVRDVVEGAGLGLEFMSTEAAARLYNVLVSEGRRFAAALIAV